MFYSSKQARPFVNIFNFEFEVHCVILYINHIDNQKFIPCFWEFLPVIFYTYNIHIPGVYIFGTLRGLNCQGNI